MWRDASKKLWFMEYDGKNKVVSSTSPSGAKEVYTYDGLGRRTSDANPAGYTRRYNMDASGNMIERFEPLGQATVIGFDRNRKVVRVIRVNVIPHARLKDISGRFNYIVDEHGNLSVGRATGVPGGGHIDLASGNPVQAAGEIKVVNGEIKYIDNSSGHYEPQGLGAQSSAEWAFRKLGFDTSGKYIEKVWEPNPALNRGGVWRPIL